MRFKHVAIEGCIGAGKTTVGKLVAQRLDANFIGEDAEKNSFLSKFYSDPSRYAFETELGFLLIHFHQLFHRSAETVVTDFTLGKDRVFAQMNLTGKDMNCFANLFADLSGRVAPPEIVVFLQLEPRFCLERIRERGIPSEQSISVDYLKSLEAAYLRNLSELGQSVRLITVNRTDTISEVVDRAFSIIAA